MTKRQWVRVVLVLSGLAMIAGAVAAFFAYGAIALQNQLQQFGMNPPAATVIAGSVFVLDLLAIALFMTAGD